MVGFLYAFGVEFFLGIIPGMIRQGTMLYYSRSILGVHDETPKTVKAIFGTEGHASVSGAVTTPLVPAHWRRSRSSSTAAIRSGNSSGVQAKEGRPRSASCCGRPRV